MGNAVAGVNGGEEAEVVAVAGGGVRDARVAELQGKDAGKGGPDDEGGDEVTGPAAKGEAAMSATSCTGRVAVAEDPNEVACVAAEWSEGKAARFMRT